MRIVSMLLLPLVIAAMVAIADYGVAEALPVKPQPLSAAAPASNLQLAYEVVHGPRGGAAVRGPRGGVAVRGPYGGAAVHGPYGGAAVRGPYGGRAVAARPYYGGVWYGTGRPIRPSGPTETVGVFPTVGSIDQVVITTATATNAMPNRVPKPMLRM